VNLIFLKLLITIKIISEKDIHITLDSKFIIQLYRTFQDAAHLHMLMEICLGGDLWSLLRDHKYFPDNTARFYIGCVVEALDYLHHLGITYRDVKPENCLISDKGYLKLADMGLAKKIKVHLIISAIK
jgi:cGMP-dependent protein kinase